MEKQACDIQPGDRVPYNGTLYPVKYKDAAPGGKVRLTLDGGSRLGDPLFYSDLDQPVPVGHL